MEFKINVNEILTQLTQVASVVAPKNAMPILGNIVFNTDAVDPNTLYLLASDGEMWLTMKVQTQNAMPAGMSFAVDAKDFVTALRGLANEEVNIVLDEPNHLLVCHYGKGSFKLPYNETNDYPHQNVTYGENATQKTINAKNLAYALQVVEYAQANDELRPQLTGVHLDLTEEAMVSVATDGRKLIRYKDFSLTSDGETKSISIPKKPSHLLVSMLAKNEVDVTMTFNEINVKFECDTFLLSTRLYEQRYPNYNSVIPTNYDKVVTCNKNELINAVKRVLTFANSSTGLIGITFVPMGIRVSAEDYDFSKSSNEDVASTYMGDEMKIGFNGTFLMQSLANIDCEEVTMELQDNSRPIVLKPSTRCEGTDYVAILMPMVL